MHVVRILAMIFLAAYLIFQGLFSFLGVSMSSMFESGLGIVAIAAGVLILISLGEKCKPRS